MTLASSGPNHKISFHGLGYDSLALQDTSCEVALLKLFDFHKGDKLKALYLASRDYALKSDLRNHLPIYKLGKLAIKPEAAGKVRVFAIVDGWTQMALKPLHDTLFGVLANIPQDGTFDQAKPLRSLLNRIGPARKVFSFDLSAATDRLPIDLQKQVLRHLVGEEYANSWSTLLVDREYSLPHKSFEAKKISVPEEFTNVESIRYAVGQPMGALSS